MKLPYRTQIFLAGIQFTSQIVFYWIKLIQYFLGLIIKFIPNNWVNDFGPKKFDKKRKNVQILNVRDQNGNDITKKFNLFVNWLWDDDVCEETGGLNIKKIISLFQTPVMYIIYLLELDKKINTNHIDDLLECLNVLKIDFTDNQVKYNNNDAKDIMFNQMSFNPNFDFN